MVVYLLVWAWWLPKGNAFCVVQLLPQKQYYRPDDLEPVRVPEPKQGSRLEYMSKEWVLELAHFNQVAGRWLAKKADRNIERELSESLVKLGFLV